MKNLSIRLKIAILYVVIALFTIPILLVSYLQMRALNDMAAGAGSGIISTFTWLYPVFIVVYFIAVFTVGRKLTGSIVFPLRSLHDSASKLSRGDVNVTLDFHCKDEIGQLTDEFRNMLASIKVQAEVLTAIADGDYSGSIDVRGGNDVTNKAIMQLLEQNNRLISEIRAASLQVSDGAAQIASGAQLLASGSTQQTAAIDQLSTSVTNVSHQADNNSSIANDLLSDTQKSGSLMEQSIDYMGNLTGAMQAINESSNNIAKVIKVIEDIAFQTNILALNAAVEAARAGQYGRGFAVVAEEVRNLASKSSVAAKETAELIEHSIKTVSDGNNYTEKTNSSLIEVGKIAANNSAAMQKLSDISAEQSRAIHEIMSGIQQISIVVQSNSASSEESAATAEELSGQSASLSQLISSFKLRDEDSAPRRIASAGSYSSLESGLPKF